MPAGEFCHPSPPPPPPGSEEEEEWVWTQINSEARCDAEAEPALASYLYSTILSHSSLERSLSFHLGNKLCSSTLLSTLLYDLFLNIFSTDAGLRNATVADLRAARFRDPACVSFSHCLLNYKGFLACQVIFQIAAFCVVEQLLLYFRDARLQAFACYLRLPFVRNLINFESFC